MKKTIILESTASAYKVIDGVLFYAPILSNGKIDKEWSEVTEFELLPIKELEKLVGKFKF